MTNSISDQSQHFTLLYTIIVITVTCLKIEFCDAFRLNLLNTQYSILKTWSILFFEMVDISPDLQRKEKNTKSSDGAISKCQHFLLHTIIVITATCFNKSCKGEKKKRKKTNDGAMSECDGSFGRRSISKPPPSLAARPS